MNQPSEESAITKPTVVKGMGYPNQREEVSPTPIGWQGLSNEDLVKVSRETLRMQDDA